MRNHHRHNNSDKKHNPSELIPWIRTRRRESTCSLSNRKIVIIFGSLLFVGLVLIVASLLFFFIGSAEESESDFEYVHYTVEPPLFGFGNQNYESFGVKMDGVPQNRQTIKPSLNEMTRNDRLVQISFAKKPERSSTQAFSKTHVPSPLRRIPILTRNMTNGTPRTTRTTPSDSTTESSLVKMWTTTPKPTTISQTTPTLAPPEVFRITSTEVPSTLLRTGPSTVKRDCSDYAEDGNGSGIYIVSPDDGESFTAYCDQETAGGGWTVIQRRIGPSVYFYNRTWQEYEEGFGDIEGSHWLGLAKIHRLAPHNMVDSILRIELHGDTCSAKGCIQQNDGFWWAEWPFKLGNSSSMYVLELGRALRGNLTNSYSTDFLMENSGYPFTTIDRDNDAAGVNCAQFRNYGGWWHSNCGHVALNGIYGDKVPAHRYMVYTYRSLKTLNRKYFIHPKKSVMMIRRSSEKY